MAEQRNGSSLPTQVDDISVDWLNAVLGSEFGTVASIKIDHFGEGIGILGELARITLEYADGEFGPATIVAKCQSPTAENQFLATAMGFYLREVNFYRQVADDVSIRVPRPFHVDAAESGLPFVLLIEDIVGSRTPDQLAGISVDEAARIISTIAPLHVQFWGSDELLSIDWLPPMNNELYKGGKAMADALYPSFAEHYADRIPTGMMATIGQACERYVELLDFSTTIGTPTFTHTDCRAENYLFGGPDGLDAVTVIDFQLSTRHVGMWDVTNLIAGSMHPDIRREHERDIIASYVEQIKAAGIDYSFDQAILEYRVCLLHQTAAQVITSDLQGGNDRGAALLEELHLRPIQAAIDNEVGDLLSQF